MGKLVTESNLSLCVPAQDNRPIGFEIVGTRRMMCTDRVDLVCCD